MLEIQNVKHYHIQDLTASNPLPPKRAHQLDESLFFAKFKRIKMYLTVQIKYQETSTNNLMLSIK
jgi:hypothetical protein